MYSTSFSWSRRDMIYCFFSNELNWMFNGQEIREWCEMTRHDRDSQGRVSPKAAVKPGVFVCRGAVVFLFAGGTGRVLQKYSQLFWSRRIQVPRSGDPSSSVRSGPPARGFTLCHDHAKWFWRYMLVDWLFALRHLLRPSAHSIKQSQVRFYAVTPTEPSERMPALLCQCFGHSLTQLPWGRTAMSHFECLEINLEGSRWHWFLFGEPYLNRSVWGWWLNKRVSVAGGARRL